MFNDNDIQLLFHLVEGLLKDIEYMRKDMDRFIKLEQESHVMTCTAIEKLVAMEKEAKKFRRELQNARKSDT